MENFKAKKGNEQDFWNFVSIIIFLLVFIAIYYFLIRDKIGVFYSTSILDLSLISIATFRLIRLVRYDKVMSFLRDFFEKKEKGIGRTIHEIIICPWCIGIWISLFVIPLYFYFLNNLTHNQYHLLISFQLEKMFFFLFHLISF